jgi:plasmid stability protein
MAINLRKIDSRLHTALKIRAAQQGWSIETLCSQVLAREMRAVGLLPKIEEEYPALPNSSGHDPKTCRIYKCGMCATAK